MIGAREGRKYGLEYGSHPRQTLDIMSTHRIKDEATPLSAAGRPPPLSPVLLFIHGGAWGSGSKELYRLFTQQMDEQLGFVTFVINYRVYPDADASSQIADLSLAVDWVSQHAPTWGGDPQRITLMGHSSGAHCASLYILQQLAKSGKLRVHIHGFIGLAGVYDIAEHYEFEAARGVHEVSTKGHAFLGRRQEQVVRCSSLALSLCAAVCALSSHR
jgi:acetyl esterase/lipase